MLFVKPQKLKSDKFVGKNSFAGTQCFNLTIKKSWEVLVNTFSNCKKHNSKRPQFAPLHCLPVFGWFSLLSVKNQNICWESWKQHTLFKANRLCKKFHSNTLIQIKSTEFDVESKLSIQFSFLNLFLILMSDLGFNSITYLFWNFWRKRL